jgi:predicted DCC family thiol-disulfide oxidoreductase YuxK
MPLVQWVCGCADQGLIAGGGSAWPRCRGATARAYLPPLPADPELWSIFYLDAQGIYSQSDAVLQICRALGGGWALLSYLRIVPRGIRNGLYRWVARNRYRWFGKRDTCRMPTAADRDRFLP